MSEPTKHGGADAALEPLRDRVAMELPLTPPTEKPRRRRPSRGKR